MGKVIDITDKLTFDGNPKLKIKGVELEVNAEAPTMLKVMGLMGNEDPGIPEILDTYNLIFPEKSRQEIEEMKLIFNDLVVVIREGIALITGEDDSQGEQ